MEKTLESTRRDFIKGAMGTGIAMTVAGAVPAIADEAPAAEANQLAPGRTGLSLAQINAHRKALVEAAGDYTMKDGTVVPAVWNKLRALINSYAYGDLAGEGSFATLMHCFDNDEDLAQAYLEMPYGAEFTAMDYCQVCDRSLAECQEICEKLSTSFYLARFTRSGVTYYRHEPFVWGAIEYQTIKWAQHAPELMGMLYNMENPMQSLQNQVDCGTPVVYALPCGPEVFENPEECPEGENWRNVIAENEVIAVTPCSCRIGGHAGHAFTPEELKDATGLCGHKLETCMYFGEEAEYAVHIGVGRYITQEEAYEILQSNVDSGLILQSMHTSKHDGICSCHGDCCGMLGVYLGLGEEVWKQAEAYKTATNTVLVVDQDPCLKCGTCVERCPMFAISLDDEGYPAVNSFCVACGQCALVCPVEARKLRLKPAEERPALPLDRMDDHNMKAGYRIEHGTL